MTVQSDLKKAIAAAEAAKGTYSMAAEATQDQTAKDEYQQMSSDMDRHLMFLNNRLSYLDKSNTLNQQQQG
jgi:rubrerythrin